MSGSALTRIDLDDAGSPEALVARILQLVPDLPVPVPIEDLCHQLDIIRIADLETEGFEAALITDAVKSKGAILIARNHSPERRRFSIAHELGHFLLPEHHPSRDGRLLCSAEQLRLLSSKDRDRRVHMEVEANRFAGLLLMPPSRLQPLLRRQTVPGLDQLLDLARRFNVSREVMARRHITTRSSLSSAVTATTTCHGSPLLQATTWAWPTQQRTTRPSRPYATTIRATGSIPARPASSHPSQARHSHSKTGSQQYYSTQK